MGATSSRQGRAGSGLRRRPPSLFHERRRKPLGGSASLGAGVVIPLASTSANIVDLAPKIDPAIKPFDAVRSFNETDRLGLAGCECFGAGHIVFSGSGCVSKTDLNQPFDKRQVIMYKSVMTKRTPKVETLPQPSPASSHLVGYTRVSTLDQDPQLQIDALLKAGVDRRDIFEDTMGGSTMDRPGFEAMMKDVQRGDIIYVWKLDRLGRSVRQVLNTFHDLAQRGVSIKVLTQPGMDTSTPMGRLIITIMAAVAEMERDLILERTLAGLAASRAMGRVGGRRQIASDAQIEAVRHLGAEAGAAAVGLRPKQFKRRLDKIRITEMKEFRANANQPE